MNFALALPIICIFAADILFLTTIQNNKLEYNGKNQYKFVTPIVVIVYIISIFMEKNFTFENILIIIGLVIFALLGNKCGVGEKGIITGSWFTPWSKIDEVHVETKGENCILSYSNRNIKKRLIFKKEEGNGLRKYIETLKRNNNIKK